jgi:hypothetical protein
MKVPKGAGQHSGPHGVAKVPEKNTSFFIFCEPFYKQAIFKTACRSTPTRSKFNKLFFQKQNFMILSKNF